MKRETILLDKYNEANLREAALAERERCAKIAEDDKWLEWDIPGSGIAGAIRSGK